MVMVFWHLSLCLIEMNKNLFNETIIQKDEKGTKPLLQTIYKLFLTDEFCD